MLFNIIRKMGYKVAIARGSKIRGIRDKLSACLKEEGWQIISGSTSIWARDDNPYVSLHYDEREHENTLLILPRLKDGAAEEYYSSLGDQIILFSVNWYDWRLLSFLLEHPQGASWKRWWEKEMEIGKEQGVIK